jgi:hypothetical protein
MTARKPKPTRGRRREGTLERLERVTQRPTGGRDLDVWREAISGLDDFVAKLDRTAADMDTRGPLAADLARRLRWHSRRLRRKIADGAPRLDLLVAIAAGLDYANARHEIDDDARRRRGAILSRARYFEAVRGIERRGERPTFERIAEHVGVTVPALRKWRKKNLERV